MLSGQMAAISKYMGPAYQGHDAARVMGGIHSGLQGANSGIGGSLFVRAAMRVGTANVGGETLDLTNPFHMRRLKEVGLGSAGGIKVAREMFNVAGEYKDRDASLEMLKQSFPDLSYIDLISMRKQNMMGKLTDKRLLRSLTAGGNVPSEDERGWRRTASRRYEYVGLEQNLRKIGTAAENLHIKFTNLVESVVTAEGVFSGLGNLGKGLWNEDDLRAVMLVSAWVSDPGFWSAMKIASGEGAIRGAKAFDSGEERREAARGAAAEVWSGMVKTAR